MSLLSDIFRFPIARRAKGLLLLKPPTVSKPARTGRRAFTRRDQVPARLAGRRILAINRTICYESRVRPFIARLCVALGLAVLVGVAALSGVADSAVPTPTYFWGAQWGDKATPVGVGLRHTPDAEGIASIREQGGQPCAEPTAYYRGGYFDAASGRAGKVTGCTIGFERLVGRFVGDKSRGFTERGNFDIRLHVGNSGEEYGLTEGGEIIESAGLVFDGTLGGQPWHAAFTQHFGGDGATDPVDPKDAVSSLNVQLKAKEYRPVYAFVKTGAKVTICVARGDFFYKPFSLSPQDKFNATLKPGQCYTTTAKNTTGATYPWKLHDDIHAREKMVIWIVPAKATGGGTAPPTLAKGPIQTAHEANLIIEKIINKNAVDCQITTYRLEARGTTGKWSIKGQLTIGGKSAVANWTIVGRKVVPANPLAADIDAGCP
jgi:hypothetical protein